MSAESIDVVFENIVYPSKLNKIINNPILKSLNGKLSSGKLIGIIGRSGAGKTTLLNILAGQISTNLKGTVRINGTCVDSKQFKSISAYLPQDILLEPCLTVKEYMMFAANLMLSSHIANQLKEQVVLSVLKSLRMQRLLDVRTECLSGGERKRLSIAIELINDPQIMLMDEPTSGLDNVSAKECVDVLKTLATTGKAIVCSIHQPSDSIFRMFDSVYFINDGHCIYDGTIQEMIPYLDSCGYPCPKTYNPADFMLELDCKAYEILKQRTLSHWNERKDDITHNENQKEFVKEKLVCDEKSNGLFYETMVLLRKNYIQLARRRTTLALNVFQNLSICVASSLLAMGNGNNAERAFDTFKFILAVIAYFHFTSIIVPVLTIPTSIKVTEKDIRNGWYNPFPYLVAEILTFLPSLIIFPTFFAVVMYTFLFEEINIERSQSYGLILILTGLLATLFGLCFALFLNIKQGAIVAPVIASVGVVLSMAGLGDGKVNPVIRTLRQISFARYSLVGSCLAIFGGRKRLECPEIFCLHASVDRLLKDMGLEGEIYITQVTVLLLFVIVFLFIYYLLLRIRFITGTVGVMKKMKVMYHL